MIKNLKYLSIIYFLLLQTGLLVPAYAQDIDQNHNPESAQHASTEMTKPALLQSTVSKQKPVIPDNPGDSRELSMFFKIGIGLNILMLVVYISWAVRQWRQSDDKKN